MAGGNVEAGAAGTGGSGEQGAEPVLWERLERPAPRAALSPMLIARAAVALADAEGFAAVTMRRLATELGVAPMAAYRYLSGKDDLWALMIDQVATELEPGEAEKNADGWREVLRAHAFRSRDMVLRHPWLAQLPVSVTVLTPNRMAAVERQLTALDGHGLDADTMMAVFRAVSSFTQGATQTEAALRRLREERGWTTGDEARDALAPQMRYLMGTGRYPTFERTLVGARRKDDATWEFETGLDCVLDGIQARLGLP